ncbi:MAG: hypothetical protein C5B50_13360 [Verrucomicrobia bacterium]|nr:MAG: hypothetical protein C5B50_13360 [Verrucomicrobiota bacterium]
MILCLGPTPAAQRVMVFPSLKLDEVNRTAVTLDGAAGKGVNVAKALKSLGQQPLVVTFLGGERGNALRTELRRQCITLDYVTVIPETRQCITVVDQSAGTQTELVQESSPLNSTAYEKLMRAVRKRMKESRAVVMSGTIPPGGPADLYLKCARLANDAGLLTVIDAQGPALLKALAARPSLVKPNRVELAATLSSNSPTATEMPIERRVGAPGLQEQRFGTVGRVPSPGVRSIKKPGRRRPKPSGVSERDLERGIVHLSELGAQRIVVTAGKEPTLAFDGRTFWRISSPRIKAVNPIGSGDSFTAALVWRLLRGDDLGEACRWGAAAGTANALTLMPGEFRRQDVEKLVRRAQIERLRR